VAAELGATTVGDLAGHPPVELARRFGQQQGAFLAALACARDDSAVRERGPQRSLAAERSFPPLGGEAAAAAELAPLARTLLERAAQASVGGLAFRRVRCGVVFILDFGFWFREKESEDA
jgi:nucleotidyltransferase/DNA polymerase involved in DNA repair